MRKWIDIVSEAPVGNIDAIDVSPEGSFQHATDRKIISNPKAHAKIRRVLARVPQTIDLVFFDTGAPVRDVNAHHETIAGVYDLAELGDKWPTLPESSSPNSIMLMLTNNEGFERVQLSPWIIVHRMGHACVMDESSYYSGVFENVRHVLNDISSALSDGWAITVGKSWRYFGTMKSAREGKLTTPLELVFELFAQYCVRGGVKLNRLTEEWIKENSIWPLRERDLERLNETVDFAETSINREFERLLKELEGKVVIL